MWRSAARSALAIPPLPWSDGREITGITAPDTFIALLRFANGGLATVRGVPIAYHRGGFSIEFNGTEGALIATNSDLKGATAADPAPVDLPLPEGLWDRAGIAKRFIRAIQDGRPSPAPNFADGVAIQAILDALDTAITTNTWVTIDQASSGTRRDESQIHSSPLSIAEQTSSIP